MFVLSFAILLALAAPAAAQTPDQPPPPSAAPEPIDADRPHVGTGTHVVAPGEVQFELGGQWQHSTNVRTFASPALVRIGVSDRVEARVATDGVLVRDAAQARERGIGNAQLGVKVRLLGSAEEPYLSVMPAVNLGLASRAKGLGSGESDTTVTLLAGHALGHRFHGEANYGVGSIGDPAGRFPQHLLTGAVVHQTTPRLQSYVEAAWWSRQERRGTAVSFIDYGVILALAPRVLMDGGAFTGVTAATPDYGLFTGLSFAIGPDRAQRAARRMPF